MEPEIRGAKPEPTFLDRWRGYQRQKRILRIRSIVDNPLRMQGLGSTRGGAVSKHSVLRFVLTCAFLFAFLTLASGLSRIFPSPLNTLPFGAASLASVEAADWVWFRVQNALDRAMNLLAIAIFIALVSGGLLLGLFPETFVPGLQGLSGNLARNFEQWRVRQNEKIHARNQIPVQGPVEGENWRLLTRDFPQGTAYLKATLSEADAACAQIGTDWGLPPSLETLRNLKPHPELRIGFYVWVRGSQGGMLEPSQGQSGRAAVRGDSKDQNVVLCVRRGT